MGLRLESLAVTGRGGDDATPSVLASEDTHMRALSDAKSERGGSGIGWGGRRYGVWLAVIALVGLVARVLFVVVIRPTTDTQFDATTYHYLGLNLAHGLGYVRPPQLGPGPIVATAEYAPLLPVLLAGATKVGLSTPTGNALVTAALGFVTIVLVGLLGRRVAGPRVGLVAAAIVALHPLLVQIDGGLNTESPYLLLVAATLLVTVWAWDEPAPWKWALAGLFAGAAVMTRAEGLALLFVVVVPAAVIRSRPGWGRALLAGLIPIAVVFVVVLPWTIRNATTFHRFVPVSNNFGPVMLGANCDGAYHGVHAGWWDFGCVAAYAGSAPENRIGPGSTNEADVYTRWRSQGIRFALDHPSDCAQAIPARVDRTWGLYWHPSNQLDNDLTE